MLAKSHIKPVLCVGESFTEFQAGKTEQKLQTQIQECIQGNISSENLIIAYAPIWAIGTGNTPKPKDVNTLVEFARFLYFAKKECKDGSIISKADLVKAKDILLEVLSIKKDMGEALRLLGEIHFQEGNFTKSKEYLNACYTKNYNKSSYLLKLAEIAKISSQPESQEKFLLEATLDSETRSKALAELFNLKLQNNHKKEALSIGFNAIKSLRRFIRNHRKELDYQLKANNFTESKRITIDLRYAYEVLSEIYFQCSDLMKSRKSKKHWIEELKLSFT